MCNLFLEVENMNFNFYWLAIYAYRNRYITRDEFMKQWENIQKLGETNEG